MNSFYELIAYSTIIDKPVLEQLIWNIEDHMINNLHQNPFRDKKLLMLKRDNSAFFAHVISKRQATFSEKQN